MFLFNDKKTIKKQALLSIPLLALIFFFCASIGFAQEVEEAPNPKFDAIFIGDQSVLELEKVDQDTKNLYIGESGKGITWLKENNKRFIEQNVEEGSNTFYMIGFNEIQNTYQADVYADYLNEVAEDIVRLGGKAYYVSINHVDTEKYKNDINPKIDAWNQVMNEKLSKDITYIDSNSVFDEVGFETLNNGSSLNEESNIRLLSSLLKQAGLMTYEEKVIENKPKPEEIKNKSGWGTDKDGHRVYYDENENIVKGGFREIGGAMYLLDENGYYKVGLQEFGGRNYYFNSVGVMRSGWVNEDGRWLLFSEKGPQLFGWQKYGKDLYYIGKEGHRLTGWWNLGTTLHYFNEDGTVGSGITQIDNETYYFADKGSVRVGWVEDGGHKYYFGDGGPMLKGKQTIDGSVYYFADDGKMYSGFRTESDGIRYYGKDGAMIVGRTDIGGSEYSFDDGGLMETGYITNSKGETLYFSKEGRLANGVETIDKEKILFKNGKVSSGWYEVEGRKRYFDENGKMIKNSWKTIDGNRYYFDQDGLFLTGKHKFSGNKHYFSDSGVLEKKTPLFVMPLIIFAVAVIAGVVFALFNKELVYDWLGNLIQFLEKDEKSKDQKPKESNDSKKKKKKGFAFIKKDKKGGKK